MRLFVFFVVAFLAVSCGKNGGSKSSGSQNQIQDVSVRTADSGGSDVLEPKAILVPVTVSDSAIVFQVAKSSTEQGDHISCTTAVAAGEVYHFVLHGDTMDVQTKDGNYTMTAISSEGSLVNRNWVWRGYTAGNVYTIRTLRIMSTGQALLKTHCEL